MVDIDRDGNLGDISKAGSLHEFLMDLHKLYGPIASFWWGKMYTISIASAELFEAQEHLFNRHRKLMVIVLTISRSINYSIITVVQDVSHIQYRAQTGCTVSGGQRFKIISILEGSIIL